MYTEFEKWLDSVLEEELPDNSAGIGFNLYEEQDNHWSIQFIATEGFDEDDPDWMCYETFSTGENLFGWQEDTNWENILEKGKALVKEYLDKGRYADVLKQYAGVGVGFVDGDTEAVYKRMPE